MRVVARVHLDQTTFVVREFVIGETSIFEAGEHPGPTNELFWRRSAS